MADKLGIKVDDFSPGELTTIDHVVDLLEDAYAQIGYLSDNYSEAHSISARDARNWKRFYEDLTAAFSAASDMPPAVLRALDEAGAVTRAEFYSFIEEAEAFLERIRPGDDLGKAKGRPQYESLELAIFHLAKFFEEHTGRDAKPPSRKTGTGPFYRFCVAVFEAAGAGKLAGHSEATMRRVAASDYRVPLDEG